MGLDPTSSDVSSGNTAVPFSKQELKIKIKNNGKTLKYLIYIYNIGLLFANRPRINSGFGCICKQII
ncbi:MAG: hypothetical protein GX801_09225 [Fibrobacter sp.]|nr:hypothetical protein [Fibrobacter sp.]